MLTKEFLYTLHLLFAQLLKISNKLLKNLQKCPVYNEVLSNKLTITNVSIPKATLLKLHYY